MDNKLLQVLVCPVCKSKLDYLKDKQALACKPCHVMYPIRDGVPILLEDEAIPTD